ncbi:hypothetical protein M1L60_42810 [Actinoplanes sp. TRM 88003]|uniref:Uncharacterized protein n=1 Tax=Paractinoplanes aksuensis TaxID=2939490 RepID=A0ABT1E2H3_9ACTN|nr:hypothetical protein [Actinoplanes aksuensis]MCO8277329.1 hypothetical protein [Actinoplanes aksuensis]
MGLFVAASVGAGPAMATTGASQAQGQAASSAAKTTAGAASRSRVIDVYSSRAACHFAGRLGERRGSWDDYDCYRVRGGYALRVEFDSWGGWNNWDDRNWFGPWGVRGHRNNFRDDFRHRGGHWGHGGRGHGGRGHGGRGHGGRFNNGVGATPANPVIVPGPGTTSP